MPWTLPRDWTTSELVTSTIMNAHIRDNLNAMFPLGSLLLRVANYTTVETAVEGRWLQCNGAAVSRTTYAVLFAHFNAQSPVLPFGTGDGSTTFNLPDLRGRMPVGEGEHANVDSMGDSDGAAIADRQAAHYHTIVSGASGGGVTASQAGASNSSGVPQYTTPVPFVNGRTGAAAGYLQDNPAFLVVGSWFIKYLA